jgi:hypothetical protein
MAARVSVRNRVPANWPRESVEEGNNRPDSDQLWTSSSGSRWSTFPYKAGK